MELKLVIFTPEGTRTPVLIVPFMELKQEGDDKDGEHKKVLIVPFMELKHTDRPHALYILMS